MSSHILLIAGLLFCAGVNALDSYNNFADGPCDENPPQQQWINRDFIDSLHLTSAGNRYHMYKMASANPRYSGMSVDEFYYDFCYHRNTTSTSSPSVGAARGFGEILALWDVTVPQGLYVEAFPRTIFNRTDSLRQRVTLTDNRSFAFMLNCWTGSNQRAWSVVSNTPVLSAESRKAIEEHAASLGFNRRNNVFIRHDRCSDIPQYSNPWHGHIGFGLGGLQGLGLGGQFGLGNLANIHSLNRYL